MTATINQYILEANINAENLELEAIVPTQLDANAEILELTIEGGQFVLSAVEYGDGNGKNKSFRDIRLVQYGKEVEVDGRWNYINSITIPNSTARYAGYYKVD